MPEKTNASKKLEILKNLIASQEAAVKGYKRILNDNAGKKEHPAFMEETAKAYEQACVLQEALVSYARIFKSIHQCSEYNERG